MTAQEEKALNMAINDELITGFYCDEGKLWCRWLNKETMEEIIRFQYVEGVSEHHEYEEEKYLSR